MPSALLDARARRSAAAGAGAAPSSRPAAGAGRGGGDAGRARVARAARARPDQPGRRLRHRHPPGRRARRRHPAAARRLGRCSVPAAGPASSTAPAARLLVAVGLRRDRAAARRWPSPRRSARTASCSSRSVRWTPCRCPRWRCWRLGRPDRQAAAGHRPVGGRLGPGRRPPRSPAAGAGGRAPRPARGHARLHRAGADRRRAAERPGRPPAAPSTAAGRRRPLTRAAERAGRCSLRSCRDRSAHPHRRGLAVRQRPAAHRPRLRLRRPLRRLQPVPADGRRPGADGQRHRRARDADHWSPPTPRASPRARSPTGTTGSSSTTCRALGLSYDLFTRTTTANHAAVSQEIFLGLLKNGYVFPQTTLGAISPSTGRTLPDRYIEGTCPICGYDGARGDQCDNCGNQLDPVDLINPVSRINGETPKFVESEHYFLDLPAFARALGDWLATRKSWRPNVLNFSVNLLDDLKPRSYTRDIDWGVPVPLEGWLDRPDKRIYVWFDAVVGYLSASIEWARRSGDPEAWRQWWQTPDADAYYFMGKDNIVFHSEIWPAQLLGYNGAGRQGRDAGLAGRARTCRPRSCSSEFLTMEGRKFSSSRNVVIYVRDFLVPLRRRRAALLHRRGRPGEPGHRLHLGGVPAPQQRRAGRRLGQPGQPLDVDGGQERRRRPARPAS